MMRWLLRGFFLLCFCIIALLTHLLFQESGLRHTLWLVQHCTPFHVEVEHSEGTLARHFALHTLHIHSPDIDIKVEELRISWRLLQVLRGNFRVDNIQASHIQITYLPEEAQARTYSLPPLPIIGHLMVEDMHYHDKDHHYHIPKIEAYGQGNRAGDWKIAQLLVDTAFGSVHAKGHIGKSIVLQGQVKDFNPFIDHPEWKAALSAGVLLEWAPQKQVLQLEKVTGAWMRKPVQGHLHYSAIGNADPQWDAVLAIGKNRLSSQGTLGPTPKITWKIEAPQLDTLLMDSKGSLFSEGTLTAQTWQGYVRTEAFSFQGLQLSDFRLDSKGVMDQHQLHVQGRVNGSLIDFSGKGSWQAGQWHTIWHQGKVGSYLLAAPFIFDLSTQAQILSNLHLVQESSFFKLAFQHQAQEQWSLALQGEDLSAEVFNFFLQGNRLAGKSDFHLRLLREHSKTLQGEGFVHLRQGRWYPTFKPEPIDFEAFDLELERGNPLKAQIDLQISKGNRLVGALQIHSGKIRRWQDIPIAGTFDVEAHDFSALSLLPSQLPPIDGRLKAQFEIKGTLGFPALVEGYLDLQAVHIPLKSMGTSVTLNQVYLKGLGQQQLSLKGSGQMGEGAFSVEGTVGLDAKRRPVISLHLDGQHLSLIQTPAYQIEASPHIDYLFGPHGVSLKGDMAIDHAKIVLKSFNGDLAASSDVIVRNSHTPRKTEGAIDMFSAIDTDLHITLSKDVRFSGWGLDTQLAGDLRIQTTPRSFTRATGALSFVQGKYRAYGQTFNLKSGLLRFDGGPISDPFVELHAERTIIVNKVQVLQPIIVGLSLRGPLHAPIIQFYSQPPLSDTDIISYLLIGKPQNEASEAQSTMVFKAMGQLLQFVGQGHGSLDFQERLRLSEFGLEKLQTGPAVLHSLYDPTLENTVFVIGKQLSDRLYLRYSYGLAETFNAIQLRYLLGRHVTLEADTSTTAGGADIVFNFDRP